MIIERLSMENFKSHRNTQIDFGTGISIIMGENGTGKSSIFEAVSFALFKQHSGKKIERLIKNDEHKMKVELDFVANGRTYRVSRERSNSGSQSKLQIKEENNYHTLLSKDKQVTNEIQRILEMDGDLFLNAIYIRQGEISDLIEKSPAEKKQMIGKLLGIESLEKAWKNMLMLINKYDREKVKIEGRLESSKGLKEDIKSKNNEISQIQSVIDDLNLKIDILNSELEQMREKKEILDKKKSVFENALNRVESKNQILKKLEKDNNNLNDDIRKIKDNERKIEFLKPNLGKLKLLYKLNEVLNDLKQLKTEKNRLNDLLTQIHRFERILEKNKSFHNDYFLISEEINSLEEKRKVFEGSRALMKQELQMRGETVKKVRESRNKIVKVLKEFNDNLKTDFDLVEELEDHLETIKPEKKKELNKIIDEINRFKEDISILKVQNSSLKKPIEELEVVKDKCPICKSIITSEKRNDLINGYYSQMQENKSIISQFNSQLEGLISKKEILNSYYEKIKKINIEMLKENIKIFEKSQSELDAINSDISRLDGKISILDEIDKNIKKNKILKEDIKDKYEIYISAKGSLESLGNLEDHIIQLSEIQRSIASLEELANNLIEKSDADLKNLKDRIIHLEELSREYERLKGAVGQKDSLFQRLRINEINIYEILEDINSINTEIQSIKYDQNIHHDLNQNLETKNQELIKVSVKKQELIGKKNEIFKITKELEFKLESFNKFQKELKNISDFIKLLNLIRDLYGKDGVQKDLRNNSRERIEQQTRNFFEQFNFEYSDIKLDENYDMIIYGPGGKNSLDMMSGGEKIAVALALRLGITQTISKSNLELIMLDEPTIHLDSYRIQELIDLLKGMSIIPQMIIVTHDSDLEEAADNILKVKKEDGISLVSSAD